MSCGVYAGRCVIDDKARRAVALADVVRTRATMLNPCRSMVCIVYRVSGMSRCHEMDHILGQLAGARSHEVNKRKGYPRCYAPHAPIVASTTRVCHPRAQNNRVFQRSQDLQTTRSPT